MLQIRLRRLWVHVVYVYIAEKYLTVAVTRHQQANSLFARYHHTDLVLQLDH